LDVYLPNTNLFFGKFAVNNYDPFVPARFSRFQSEILENIPVNTSASFAFLNIGMVHKTDLAGEKIYHFPIDNAERYHFITCPNYSSSEDDAFSKTKELFLNGGFVDMVVLEGLDKKQPEKCAPESEITGYQVLENKPNYQKISVEPRVSGWLIQMDTWYPGWMVKIDGNSAALLRADYLFRGVKVLPGSHIIEFIYQPKSFVIGFLLSVISLTGFVVWIILEILRRKHYE
jgi:hypothetical protein